jgi:hypothetical protein
MTGLSVSPTSVSAVARGIAEADSVDIAANAQTAAPISNKRFIFMISLVPRYRGKEAMFREPLRSALESDGRNNQRERNRSAKTCANLISTRCLAFGDTYSRSNRLRRSFDQHPACRQDRSGTLTYRGRCVPLLTFVSINFKRELEKIRCEIR